MTRVNYRNGDWFAVPLRSGGFATGLVARSNPKGVSLGYFFGPKYTGLPQLSDVADLKRSNALMVGRFGDLGLVRSEWPILGRFDEWKPSEWPMPVFVRHEELTGRAYRVFYAEHDPNKPLREQLVLPREIESGPRDAMMGAGFVEEALSTLLG
jgi:Immunity protein 26